MRTLKYVSCNENVSKITLTGETSQFQTYDKGRNSLHAKTSLMKADLHLSSVAWSTGAQLIIFFCFRFSVVLFDRPGISIRHAAHCVCRVPVFASS